MVGRATGARLAELAATAELVLAPGAIGLVAVDSFALRTPIVTTNWPFHRPEAEYLVDGVNARITPNDVQGYADAVRRLLSADDEMEELRRGCAASSLRYTLEEMVSRFAGGVLEALDAPPRWTVEKRPI